MAFYGLFIGIDRYSVPEIGWLTCARRDAMALYALFSDTLGGTTLLLTDQQATRAAIEAEFLKLAQCQEDDVVVIAYSGHGSEAHELVTYDADPTNLETSCITLETLHGWFENIPSRHLICFLDCCFAGDQGAKVLKVDAKPRSMASTGSLLEQLSGEGRLIFSASSPQEEAWEHRRSGHGLMTYYLIEALRGADEVRQDGRIAIYRLLEYVAQNVTDAAARIGKSQHPVLRGKVQGTLLWPVFQPGALYRAAFPEQVQTPVTANIADLAAYGFPPVLLQAWGEAIPGFNTLQQEAINAFGLLNGEHLVVSAPTSSGKTMIGELAALKGVLERRRALFLLPLKALVNDKHQQFQRTYGAFGLRTIRATSESTDDISALMRGQYDVCLMTYEKFAGLALAAPHLLEQIGTVVVDEVQMIADASRGVNLEFILTLLRMRREQGIEPQIIALSAVIGDTNGLERWLGARLLRRTERPVPLEEGLLLADGSFRHLDPDTGEERLQRACIQPQWGKGSSQDWIIPLVRRLVGEGKQVIVFRETRGEARGCALYLASNLNLPPAQEALDSLPEGDPSIASQSLRQALTGGVAFHISDLDREQRRVIEEQFRRPGSAIRAIAATTTLAMGVNTPAEAIVIAGLEHPGDPATPYSIAEYKNIVGRAGRLGFTQRGSSYLLAVSSREEVDYWNRYVLGTPEDLQSQFLMEGTDPRTLIVRVLAAAQRSAPQGLSAADVVGFLEGSFGAFQQAHRTENWAWNREHLMDALKQLREHDLIEHNEEGNYRLTELGRLAGHGIEVESIIRLVNALTPLGAAEITDPALLAAAQLTVEMDAMLFPMNKRSTQKEPQTWPYELGNQSVPAHILRSMQRGIRDSQQATLRAKKAVGCLLWITDMPMAAIEAILTQFGGKSDGAAGAVRGVSARVCDVLPTVARVAEILHPGLDLADRVSRLLVRLELGVTSAAIPLALLAGNNLARADYQRLVKSSLCTEEALVSATDEALLACLEDNPEKLNLIRQAQVKLNEASNNVPPRTMLIPAYEP